MNSKFLDRLNAVNVATVPEAEAALKSDFMQAITLNNRINSVAAKVAKEIQPAAVEARLQKTEKNRDFLKAFNSGLTPETATLIAEKAKEAPAPAKAPAKAKAKAKASRIAEKAKEAPVAPAKAEAEAA